MGRTNEKVRRIGQGGKVRTDEARKRYKVKGKGRVRIGMRQAS